MKRIEKMMFPTGIILITAVASMVDSGEITALAAFIGCAVGCLLMFVGNKEMIRR